MDLYYINKFICTIIVSKSIEFLNLYDVGIIFSMKYYKMIKNEIILVFGMN